MSNTARSPLSRESDIATAGPLCLVATSSSGESGVSQKIECGGVEGRRPHIFGDRLTRAPAP